MSIIDFPDALKTADIMQILQISQPTAIKLLQHAEKNPTMFCVRRIGNAYRVGKEGFYKWLNDQQAQ